MALKNRVAVVMRHLPNHDPVITTVIALPEDMEINRAWPDDHYDGYLTAMAEETREKFIGCFPEFRSARWEITCVTMDKPMYGPRN